MVLMIANLEIFSFIAFTADDLQVKAAFLIGDSGLFQRLSFSFM
ncbi:hypothetical protein [Nostoc sp. NZL]|nr:hypothetical protein [Nostoc sp. NZL]